LLSAHGQVLASSLSTPAPHTTQFSAGAFTLVLSGDRKRLAILDAPAYDTARVMLLKQRVPGFREPSTLEPKLREGPPTKPEREQLQRLRSWMLRTASTASNTTTW
jgi:hypothetical protein